jgi:flagellar basal-body rod modification protein FlgD
MTSVDGIGNNSSILEELSRKEDKGSANEEQKTDFLKLMIAQLENQNPLEPQDNGEFLSQLAQFNAVDGIERLNQSVADMSSSFRSGQALQATALVGRSVQVPRAVGSLGGTGSLEGSVELPASTNDLKVNVYNDGGELIRTVNVGTAAAGDVPFSWDGLDKNGNRQAPGVYRLEAIADQYGESSNFKTYLNSNVDSVTVSQNGQVTLNVAGHGSVTLDDIKQIN